MKNVVIVGSGPAGISTALYTVRAGIPTTVIGRGGGSLSRAERIENYYGLGKPVTGSELLRDGISQALAVGADVVDGEVVGIAYENRLVVRTLDREYEADSVVLATGSVRSAPKIPGLSRLEGRGVSYCAVCDAFFYRGRNVAVIGAGEYALHEAAQLRATASTVTLLTNGAQPSFVLSEGLEINTRKIASLEGDETLRHILFEDGSTLPVSGVFVAMGVAGSGDLARKLGAETEGSRIVVDGNMHTNIPGLFAAGDCTGGMLQIAKAVYEGARAGTEVVRYLRAEKAG